MVEEPYHTEAYNTPGLLHDPAPRHFLGLAYRASLPNLQPASSNIADHHLNPKKFDTMKVQSLLSGPLSDSFNKLNDISKVAARGTLQRMKVRGEKTEEDSEVVEADDQPDHLEQEDPRHSTYNPVSLNFDFSPIQCTGLTLFLLQQSSF